MSERGQIEVFLAVTRIPTKAEQRELLAVAFDSAHDLAKTVGGRVIGFVSVARAIEPSTGREGLRFAFEVEAPESTWHHRKSFAIPTKVGSPRV